VAPLRLGGLRGKQSTPSDWLGGTGEPSLVGEKKWRRVREATRSVGRCPRQARGNGMILIGVVECTCIFGNFNVIDVVFFPFIHRSDCMKSFCQISDCANLNNDVGMCNFNTVVIFFLFNIRGGVKRFVVLVLDYVHPLSPTSWTV